MSAKRRRDPVQGLFMDVQKSGEMLVARFRLAILIFFIPLIYALRFLLGYLIPSYWLMSIGKWMVMSAVSALIYMALKKGLYRPWLGYLTIFLDTSFVTISIITLSFYTFNHTGVLQDPLLLIYYLISASGGIRYAYRYIAFTVPLLAGMIVLLSWFDSAYHAIPVDYIVLTDRLAFLILISIMALFFSRMLRDFTFERYRTGQKHIREISSLMEIGRTISSREELAKTLVSIVSEAKKLLQADLGFISVRTGEDGKLDIISETGPVPSPAPPDIEWRIGAHIVGSGRALEIKPGSSPAIDAEVAGVLKKRWIQQVVGIPVSVEGEILGAIVAARRDTRAFTGYDTTLLAVLSQQAAISIKNANLLEKLKSESVYLGKETDYSAGFHQIIGQSGKMREVFAIIEKAAKSGIPVLIRGESGTGKELVANALFALGERKDRPFIKLNCSAIPADLLESELFGHEKGAFTGADRQRKGKFELADGGTMFLDEIGDMSPGLQTKLLRVLQEGEFHRIGGDVTIRSDVRLVTATNQNLEEKIRRGEFREDLFYRINALPIHVPPLRERREDIPLLAQHFVRKHDYVGGRNIEFTVSAIRFLASLEWRGNVRELENFIHRILVMTDTDTISEKELKAMCERADSTRMMDYYSTLKAYINEAVNAGCDVAQEMERIEREFLAEAFRKSRGNIRKTAEITGLPKSTLFNKLQKYHITD
ncbi:MAG TPA: sigma 54-interacting transcriptional regulator [Spirochaetota bacterium]|nr:sigma 54-interacting transcriptional regulator [Spirochaetota bacterium]HOD15414.1 sigma 54-interacting transcriptional regulator [Spirochaetota bacterium]HPG50250.1 sigma 54-interacting transcriptional regulator [Spirochaetota bacterium]HPN11440.1 sigma 54-interacting transcriptional regulator [Spirochaetota bacterium]